MRDKHRRVWTYGEAIVLTLILLLCCIVIVTTGMLEAPNWIAYLIPFSPGLTYLLANQRSP